MPGIRKSLSTESLNVFRQIFKPKYVAGFFFPYLKRKLFICFEFSSGPDSIKYDFRAISSGKRSIIARVSGGEQLYTMDFN